MINEQSEKANRAWVLALASVASFMVALDALAVTTALSTMRSTSAPRSRCWNGR